MENAAHIFLGANSGGGFFSLYDQLLHGRLDDLLIIKGGPGCGKSSFMRAVAKELAAAGWEPIYVNCSGDPDSLDGVLFPAQKVGLADGTAPHVLEPTYTAAAERYLDLTRFYDVEAARARREEIVSRSDAYRAAYAEAYRILRAADALESERRAVVRSAADVAAPARRLESILRRELKGGGTRRGRVDRAFLGGMTHKGELCRFDTAEALCARIVAVDDSYGLAADALAEICDRAAEAGYDVLACPNPDRPRELHHVLLPAAGLAFVTAAARLPYTGDAYRRVRFDAAAAKSLTREQKANLRLTGRIGRCLRDEAVGALSRAKREHDALERAYNPCVDFDGVYALAAAEAKRLLQNR